MSLRNNLKRLLFENDIKPSDLSKATSLPVSTITRIINGQTKHPTQQSIDEIAQYFNCTAEYLLDNNENIPTSKSVKHIPHWKWDELESGLNGGLRINNNVVVAGISDKAFALNMPDHSMEPIIEKGSLLIFDNTEQAVDRNYVLVKLSNVGKYVVRQLLIDVENSFIQSLNNNIGDKSMRLLTKEDKIVARLVEVRKITI